MKKLILYLSFYVFLNCSKNEEKETPIPIVVAELIHYTFEIDSTNHTFIWDYKVKFKNTSLADAKGHAVTYHKDLRDEDVSFSNKLTNKIQCPIIPAGEECIFEYYESGIYDPNLWNPNSKIVFDKGVYYFEE